jgi:flavin-dependent dehydrogenase
VTVLEKRGDSGEKLHTTGILVKEAVEEIPLLEQLPPEFVRRINGVRLYAPNLRSVDLDAPGYYFLATDTPAVMRWLAAEATRAGARVRYDAAFRSAERSGDAIRLSDGLGDTRFLVGADGPHSRVAKVFKLGASRKFLGGIENEYAGAAIEAADRLHCFVDRRLMPGYIGWVVQGVGAVQVGLARRLRGGDAAEIKQSMSRFLGKISGIFDFRARTPTDVRAGLIPCGGLVSPVAASRVLLVGDAAGMVSPVTAGGIHTALKHGLGAGQAIADFLEGRAEDPSLAFVRTYPAFRVKRVLRFLFDHLQSDLAFNLALATKPMRLAASIVYFHHRGVFEPK